MNHSVNRNKLILSLAVALLVTCVNSTDPNLQASYKESGGSWTYSPSASASHVAPPVQATQPQHEKYEAHYMGPKQGALIGSPFYGVFPVIFLIGLAAIIIIPLLFFTFSPYGFAYSQGQYGRKRSMVDDWDMTTFKKNILDLAVNVGDAIDKYGGLASAAVSMASASSRSSPGSSGSKSKDKPK